jgi:hypothetical protein
VFIFEDGDRYVIRALCIFRQYHVVELLHDRSIAGMRAASHLLGLALREMSDAGAEAVFAWSLVHSGSYPIYARHAFLPTHAGTPRTDLRLGVRILDPALGQIGSERHHWYLSGLDFDEN